MSLLSKSGTLVAPATSGNHSVTGLGFQPKGLILVGPGDTFETVNTFSKPARGFMSVTDGTTHRCASYGLELGATNTANGRLWSASPVAFVGAAGALYRYANFVSFDADGFTLNWGPYNSLDSLIAYYAFGGDLVEAHVAAWSTGASPSATAQTVTGLGFSPDVLFNLSASIGTFGGTGTHAFHQLGIATASDQFATSLYSQNGVATTNTSAVVSDEAFLVRQNSAGAVTSKWTAELEADGFTVTPVSHTDSNMLCATLCLGGLNAKLIKTRKAKTNTTQTLGGVGFKPQSAISFTHTRTGTTYYSSGTTVVDNWNIGLSAVSIDPAGGFTQLGGFATQPDGQSNAASKVDAGGLVNPSMFRFPGKDGRLADGDVYGYFSSMTNDGLRVIWDANTTYDHYIWTLAVSTNREPNAPTSLAPAGSTSIDKDVTQRFSWAFSDPDTALGDTQSAYELRYKIVGAGTWTTVTGGATQYRDFTGGTLTAGDYEWQVRTTDNGGLTGAWSASAFFTAAAVPTGHTITAPTVSSTIDTDTYYVTWTSADQDAYQLRVLGDDGAGSPDTLDVHYDSGTVTSVTARSRLVSFPTNGIDVHVQVRIQADGLWSDWVSNVASVSYTPPATPTLELYEQTAGAAIGVAVVNAAPTGSEPTVLENEVWVRVAAGGRQDIDRTVDDDGIRIGTAGNNGTFIDYAVASGTEYQYRVKALGDNDVTAWSAWVGDGETVSDFYGGGYS